MLLFTRDGTERQPNGKTDKGAPVFRSEKTCWRCGGLGGAEAWKHTGWTCFRCGGKGIDPNKLEEKLYTAEKLAKLNAAQEKRDEKKRIAREEAAQVEADRKVRERDEVLSRYADTIKRIRAAAPIKYNDSVDYDDEGVDPLEGESFLASIYRQITVQYRALTQAQEDALETVLTKIETEKARAAAADWIGHVNDKVELTLTLEKVVSWGEQYSFGGVTFLCIMRTPEGHKVLYKGSSPYSLGLETEYDSRTNMSSFKLGQTVRVKATIKEHARSKYNNERETYIARPKALETKA